jgi:peptide/nickel transport system substrate-binding protein
MRPLTAAPTRIRRWTSKIEAALASEPGEPEYEENVKGFIAMAWQEMPRVPVVQPNSEWRCSPACGYQYWFHRQLDFRQLEKA